MEDVLPSSPIRKTIKKDAQAEDNSGNNQDLGESSVTNVNPAQSLKLGSQMVTRSRHISGQSNADVSEAESTTSNRSTRLTRSRQNLGHLADSPMKIRNRQSVLMTEPIIESKEGELSEAESNCSSVSTRARRRPPRTVPRSVNTRSRKSALVSEPISDHSEAESNCSFPSGVQNIATRSTRKTVVKSPPSPVSEYQQEEISDNESCSSGYSLQPIAKSSSSINKYKLQSDGVECISESNRDGSQEQETLRKTRHSLRCVTVSRDLSPVMQQNILSSPRRSLRKQQVKEREDVVIVSVNESQSKENSNEVSEVEQPVENETPMRKDEVDLPVDVNAASITKLCISRPTEMENVPDKTIDFAEEFVDEEQSKEQMERSSDDDGLTIDETSKSGSVSNLSESEKIYLILDSDDNEDTLHSEAGDDGKVVEEDEEMEENREMEEEEDNNELVKKGKLKEASTQQLKDVVEDGLFIIDKAPGFDSSKKYYVEPEEGDIEAENEEIEKELSEPNDDDDDDDFIDEDEDEELLNRPKKGLVLSTSIDTGMSIKEMGGLYISFDAEKPNPGPSLLNKMKKENKKKDELLQKSVITPDFEKKEAVPPYTESLNKLKKQRREERNKTTGRGWFDMKAPEMTEELKNDLKALKMRSAMDPKHFYKKNDRDGFPKYFQVGTVVDSPVDYYHSRVPKKERKRTIVEELLADSEFRRYNKKKYQEIIAEKAARAEGKKKRKKKKFHT
ncbi:deoxynucleotidyltransferase terminal-interacting protein 2 isoform X2 [Mixophyes fleayi]